MATMNKRKRESQEIASARAAPSTNQIGNEFEAHYLQGEDDTMGNTETNMDFNDFTGTDNSNAQTSNQGASASDTAAAAMAQYHTMTVPQSTEQSFLTQSADLSTTGEQSSTGGQQRTPSGNITADFDGAQAQSSPNGDTSPTAGPSTATYLSASKPAVGTDEWHKVRKDNHKEVERRRRETINEGINELAKIVPGCEKNKGSILGRAVQFITQLKENETQNIEKWTLEKLLTEQAIAELSSSCDKLKAECQRAWEECEQWKKVAQKAGLSIESAEKGDADADEAE